jgi:hypothetical protein
LPSEARHLEKALAEDAPKAKAGYLGVLSKALDGFIPADVVETATDRGVCERPP